MSPTGTGVRANWLATVTVVVTCELPGGSVVGLPVTEAVINCPTRNGAWPIRPGSGAPSVARSDTRRLYSPLASRPVATDPNGTVYGAAPGSSWTGTSASDATKTPFWSNASRWAITSRSALAVLNT